MPPANALVLFDIDGTLLRRAGLEHKAALIEGVRRVTGLPASLDGIATGGMLDRDLLALLMQSAGQSARRIRDLMPRLVQESESAYLGAPVGDLSGKLCPGVVSLIEELTAEGAALALVTGNLVAIGWRKIELAGLRRFFSFGAFSQHGSTRALLARAAVRQARRERRITTGARISLVGDHPNDVRAARANRILAIATGTGLTPFADLNAEQPDLYVPDLTHLRARHLLP